MTQNQFVNSDIWHYCLDNTKLHSHLLSCLKKDTYASVPGSHMLSETMVVKLLQFFIILSRAKICVDLGTYTGLSALAMAEAVSCHGVDDSIVYTIDKQNQAGHDLAEKYIRNSPYSEKINILIKDAACAIKENLPDKIDFVFIDSGKTDIQHCFDLLLPRLSIYGMIIVDDVLWRGQVLHPVSLRAKNFHNFNRYIASHKGIDNIILPIRHGLQLIIKRNDDH